MSTTFLFTATPDEMRRFLPDRKPPPTLLPHGEERMYYSSLDDRWLPTRLPVPDGRADGSTLNPEVLNAHACQDLTPDWIQDLGMSLGVFSSEQEAFEEVQGRAWARPDRDPWLLFQLPPALVTKVAQGIPEESLANWERSVQAHSPGWRARDVELLSRLCTEAVEGKKHLFFVEWLPID